MPCHASEIGPRWISGSNGISIMSGGPPSVALLVLLARAAVAGIVAAQLLLRSGAGLLEPAAARRALRGPRVPLLLLLLLGLVDTPHADPEDHLRGGRGQPGVHLLPVAVRLLLVGDERVLLAVAAEVDALSQLLHLGQVLDPMRIDRAQQDEPLDLA